MVLKMKGIPSTLNVKLLVMARNLAFIRKVGESKPPFAVRY